MDTTFTPEEIQFQCDLDVSYELIEGGSINDDIVIGDIVEG